MASPILALTENNKAFSRKIPGLQLAWDSVSIDRLKTCPRKYYYTMIEGWEKKTRATPLTFGIYFHKGMEFYHKSRAEGMLHDEAVYSTVLELLKISGTRDPETGVFSPWDSDCSKRNRFTLIRAVVWYLEEYGESDTTSVVIRSDGSPMAELSFRFILDKDSPAPDTTPYMLCGHFDAIVDFSGQKYVMDYKTTASQISSKFFDGFSPANQMSLYTFAGGIVLGEPLAGVIIDGVQTAVTFNRFGRGFAPRTPAQIDEWYSNLKTWLAIAETYADQQQWPMNDTSGACGMYGGCEFREVCSKDSSVRQIFLEGDFQRSIWDPLTPRN